MCLWCFLETIQSRGFGSSGWIPDMRLLLGKDRRQEMDLHGGSCSPLMVCSRVLHLSLFSPCPLLFSHPPLLVRQTSLKPWHLLASYLQAIIMVYSIKQPKILRSLSCLCYLVTTIIKLTKVPKWNKLSSFIVVFLIEIESYSVVPR